MSKIVLIEWSLKLNDVEEFNHLLSEIGYIRPGDVITLPDGIVNFFTGSPSHYAYFSSDMYGYANCFNATSAYPSVYAYANGFFFEDIDDGGQSGIIGASGPIDRFTIGRTFVKTVLTLGFRFLTEVEIDDDLEYVQLEEDHPTQGYLISLEKGDMIDDGYIQTHMAHICDYQSGNRQYFDWLRDSDAAHISIK